MKTAIVVYQDAAGEPQDALDGRTLLQAARARAATRLAQRGCGGWLCPPATGHGLLAEACGMPGDEANLLRCGPLEAWLLERPPAPGDLVYHGDLIAEDRGIIRSAPVPGSRETTELAAALNLGLGPSRGRFEYLDHGTLLLILSGAGAGMPEGLSTDQVLNHEWLEMMPPGRDGARLREIMHQAGDVLSRHPVNDVRVDLGEDPANGLWLHGGGCWPDAATASTSVPSTIMLSGLPVGRGVARMLGMPCQALRRSDTDDAPWFSVPDLVKSLRDQDSLVVDVAPTRGGGPVDKVRELDRIDQYLLAPLVDVLAAHRPYRIALVAGSSLLQASQSRLEMRAPVVVAGDDLKPDSVSRWDETACNDGILGQIQLSSFANQLKNAE